ncbi:MAG: O-antigen ligase family protein [Thermodesulfovibrionales bacterium]
MAYICGVALLDIAGLISSKFQFYGPFSSLGMHHIWFGNLNALAFYGLMALLFMSWEKRKTHLLISASLIILFLFSLIMSTSRTAWLGIMVSLCVVSFMLFRRKRQFWYVATGLLMVVVIFYFTVPVVKQRVSQVMMDINAFLSGNEATSIGARFTMWIASLKIFLNNPLFGAGTGDYNIEIENLVREGEIPPFISRYNQPHSIYMNELATNGLLGFIALVYIFIKPLILSKKEKGSFNILLWLVLVHYMVAGLTESLFNIHVLINSFAFLLGLVRRWENSNLKRPLMQNQLDIKSS